MNDFSDAVAYGNCIANFVMQIIFAWILPCFRLSFAKTRFMKDIEIQLNLIQLIMENKGNSLFLQKLADYAHKLMEEQDWWDDLSETQKNFVHKSAQQIDEGKVISNAVVRENIKHQILARFS
jgi:hypothetical protein